MKLSGATGNPLWTVSGRASNNSSPATPSHAYSVGVTGGKVIIGGHFRDTVSFSTHNLTSNYLTDSGEAFLLQLDAASGSIEQAVKLSGGDGPSITLIARGNKNNFYVGGIIGTKPLTVGGSIVQDPPSYHGSFIAKWGFNNCNCILPTPNYTSSTVSGTTVRYTYTGTSSGIDSLVWEWGDGSGQKVTAGFTTPITHAYATGGKYNVCVTAYNDTCGQNRYCGQTALAVAKVAGDGTIRLYPNPVSDKLIIEEAAGTRAVIFNSLGQKLFHRGLTSNREIIKVHHLPAGFYLLRIEDANGIHTIRHFIKQ
jgi:hypothetical protein